MISYCSQVNEIENYQIKMDDFSVGFVHDKDNNFTLNDVVGLSFETINSQHSFGINHDVTWYKVSFVNRTPTPKTLYLHDNLAFMSQQIDIFEFVGKQQVDQNRYKLFEQEGNNKLSGSTLVYSFTLAPDATTTLYIKNHVLIFQMLDLKVYDEHDSTQVLIDKNIYSNIIVVFLVTLAFYNVMLFVFSRRKEFIFYSMYLLNGALGLFYMYGSVIQHTKLFGLQVYWFNISAIFVSFFLALFIKSIFDINKENKKVNFLLNSILVLSLFDLIIALAISLPFAIKIVHLIFVYTFFVITYIGFYFYKKQHPLAIIFCTAYSIYIISFSMTLLMLMGMLPYSDLAFHASGIGLVFEAVLFSYMISYRIKLLEQDVTKHKNVLLIKNKKAQMGDMITAITHQWKQPLTAISSIITLLQYQLDDKEKISTDELKLKAAQINEKVCFLSETIDDFRHFFEPEKNYKESDIGNVVNKAVALLHDDMMAANIIVKTELNFSKKIAVYKNELLHIVLNIMQNSKEAFESSQKTSKMIKIIGFIEDERLIIDIIDNAGGISKNKLPHIFDEFYTTKNKQAGSGLGLYLSKFIIENHMHGHIDAVNLEDGVMFRITI